jgi:hypothetical protein
MSMNLVQINERLKDMPIQVLKQYANGQNPEVPPYLALGEIQRRQQQEKMMANAQGAAQGQQPSVKEQIEQSAGLMALQKAQMAQKQQQMMAPPSGPMPVPPGAPQPRPQPQAPQETFAAYSGGLARIPVRDDMYKFAGGGIIAFQEGGQSPKVITLPADATQEMIDKARQDNPDAIIRRETPRVALPPQEQATPVPPVKVPPRPAPAPTAKAPPGKPAPQQAPQAPAPQGIAALGQVRSDTFAPAFEAASKMPKEATPEAAIQNVQALTPEYLGDAAIKQRQQDFQARQQKAREDYEASKPSGLDQLIRVFGQAGQYKGLSGLGPAYTQAQDQRRAQEAAFRRQQELDTREQEKGMAKQYEDIFGARTKQFATDTEGFRREMASRREALAAMAGVDQRAIDSALERMNNAELTALRIAAEKASAGRPSDRERFVASYLGLKAKDPTKAQAYMEAWVTAGGGDAGMLNAATRERRQRISELNSIIDIGNTSATTEQKQAAQKELNRLILEEGKNADNAAASAKLPPGFKMDK